MNTSPNDKCVTCGCPRWRHGYYQKSRTIGHCRRCGGVKCPHFKRGVKGKEPKPAGRALYDIKVKRHVD